MFDYHSHQWLPAFLRILQQTLLLILQELYLLTQLSHSAKKLPPKREFLNQ